MQITKEEQILGIVKDCLRRSGSTTVTINVSPDGETAVEAVSSLSLQFENNGEVKDLGEVTTIGNINANESEHERVVFKSDDFDDAAKETVQDEEVTIFKESDNRENLFSSDENAQKKPNLFGQTENRFGTLDDNITDKDHVTEDMDVTRVNNDLLGDTEETVIQIESDGSIDNNEEEQVPDFAAAATNVTGLGRNIPSYEEAVNN